MNKILLYIVIVSYSVIILKPVLPTLSDTVAHIFWYSEHIATVHSENGKYHVHFEYAAAAKKGYPEKSNSLKEDEQVNFHLLPVTCYHFTVFKENKAKFISTSSALVTLCQGCDYPPPRTA